MPAYGIAEARDRLSELLARAERGEEVVITRNGKPVIHMTPYTRRASVEELRGRLARMPAQGTPISELIVQMRGEDDDANPERPVPDSDESR